MEKIIGFMCFDKDLKCRGFQYEVGKEYETDKEEIFRFFKNPFNLFIYRHPYNKDGFKRFCIVEGSGKIDTSDSVITWCTKLKVVKEISFKELILKASGLFLSGIRFDSKLKRIETGEGFNTVTANRRFASVAANSGEESVSLNDGFASSSVCAGVASCSVNTGERSAASNTGESSLSVSAGEKSVAVATCMKSLSISTENSSVSASTGDESTSLSEGDGSVSAGTGSFALSVAKGTESAAVSVGSGSYASAEGEESIALAAGKDSKAKGCLGSYIVLTERGEWNGSCHPVKKVKAFKIDGNKIKANTYYTLKNGKATEVE